MRKVAREADVTRAGTAATGVPRMLQAVVVAALAIMSGSQSAQAQLAGGVVEEWAMVVTVTPQWLVLQNEQGQQFPVSTSRVRLFVIRWPTSLDRISPSALLEVTGMNRGSNMLVTQHIDVYEGAARGMVVPGVLLISASGVVSRPIDFLINPEVYGAPFPGYEAPIHSGVGSGPQLTHVVGPLASRLPLQIAIGGNNFMTVMPTPGGVHMSQVTTGSIGLVKPGDIAYLAVTQALTDSLTLDQLVVYKQMFLDQFTP